VFFLGYFTTPSPPMVGQASSPDIMMTSGDACPTRGILYAIHRIALLNEMKIPIQFICVVKCQGNVLSEGLYHLLSVFVS